MKKYLFLVICFAVLGISQAKAQAAKVALQHDGNVTLFNADELQKALDASVDGDIIYLNEGTFKGGVTISKKVSVIGAGENTTIDGSLTVKSDGVLVDALQIKQATLYINAQNDVHIRKCTAPDFSVSGKNILIDRCFQSGIGISYNFKIAGTPENVRVINSKIADAYVTPSNVNAVIFVNCNVSNNFGKVVATFLNCIVSNYEQTHMEGCYFTNCRLYKSSNTVNQQNCEISSFNWSGNYEYTGSNLLGTDGTQIGIYGGTTPFTLVPSVPIVKSYDLKVDTSNKKLNVNISVESK